MIRAALERLESDPAREAVVGLDARGAVRWRMSARDVLAAIGGWQVWLDAQGVEPGERVALDLPRGPELLPAHLAVLASGACAVPINPALSEHERARVLERAEVRAMLDAAAERPSAGGPVRLAEAAPGAPALLIFTSGTTGEPKGVPLSRENLEANLDGLAGTWGLRPDERLLHALPAHHVHGLVLALYGSARMGMPVWLMERFDAERVLGALAEHGIAVFMGVPTMYHRMIDAPGPDALPSMRLFVSGSAPLAEADFHGFESRFGFAPLERYGLTETLIVASNPLDGARVPGTVGRPLPRTEVRLANDGEIEVRGPGVMCGYWQDEETSAASFRDGFFRTGDLGAMHESGHLRIAGRLKELIIVGGSNVLPGEVEHALAGEPGVDELVAAGVPDADRGEIVGAFVVVHEGGDPAALRELETRLRERAERELAPYKRPRLYRFLAELPRNAMGKVDRRSLR
ncbi:MAG: AMP-binding protein [Deltaproteobacteria bacterium]|nr:AMP-binding protein [Deltaproteobacteria bacterium]